MTNNADNRILALYGGTFDPIHQAHINTVKAMAAEAGLEQVILLPNNVPPHRPQPKANAQQRLMMAQLAVNGDPLFRVDDRELHRDALSYTVETLRQYRSEIGSRRPLAFIIGQDSLLSIDTWHEWDKILTLCHILVCKRPGYTLDFPSERLADWFVQHLITTPDSLHKRPSGYIFLADTPLFPISATNIRERLKNGEDCRDQLAPAVQDYILEQGLYR
ncbi:nicotinate-nucleotide adenylyltransferase [Morganella morganii]|uniref:Probable nicotinate-nucleotide adenylyltransferase n=1 Tax=Morganella morganii TaxID=582 RepID=A0A9Q4CJJ4_MORMO|nr:nicotinate-nucleotide adenylyltransferase [Morganella morganii]BEP22261.1 nicotinate-nucleotide adenylyltransferase [Morganella morganii subsp. sibonii]EKK5375497.1 nicotinate-nucleotide adenylyltransferase [Morganella morganii]EKW7747100.1 nicotinate-nucleotide adenylyltransferase [Morganella morganii]ELB1543316.1 nicotinate-nucleotide adenylyltransferase [Morganella morganii]MBS9542006.1 nicotinate-nucleotide adenylyltransferase [Morganella morganii subsp. morganii]